MSSNRKSYTAYGIRILLSKHPEVRKLKRTYSPSVHGTKNWSSSWLIMDYLKKHHDPSHTHVMEVGCGWGPVSIFCAKTFGAFVTGVDIDSEVFPFFELQAKLNGVSVHTMQRDFRQLRLSDLSNVDLLLGSDISFWPKLKEPLKLLIRRALRAGVKRILLADPGRDPFMKLADEFTKRKDSALLEWSVRRPRPHTGYILVVQAS